MDLRNAQALDAPSSAERCLSLEICTERLPWVVICRSSMPAERTDVVAAAADTKAQRIAWRAAETDIRTGIIAACAKASLADRRSPVPGRGG
jgi:hypothetical protein